MNGRFRKKLYLFFRPEKHALAANFPEMSLRAIRLRLPVMIPARGCRTLSRLLFSFCDGPFRHTSPASRLTLLPVMKNSRSRRFRVPLITANQFATLLAVACLAPVAVYADATPGAAQAPLAGTTKAPLAGTTKAPLSAAKTTPIKLAAGEQLAHKVVTGALGPWSHAQVWLTQSSEVDDAPFAGRVVATDGTVHALPAPDEPESTFMMKVRSVMFRNVDQQPDKELIVLYSAAKIGPQQPPYYGACVYQWNGSAFTRLTDVESKLGGVKSSAEVSKRLASAAASKVGSKK